MKTSEQGRDFIRAWETLRLSVYRDGVDKLTIGWGHLIRPRDALRLGDRISAERAESLFEADLVLPEDEINELGSVVSNQHEFDALVSFCFNAGLGAFQGSTLLKRLRQDLKAAAGDEFLRWNKGHLADGTVIVLAGLTKRREAERRMFLTGVYDATH